MTINPQPLETIEFASRDEIEALQLTRLKWTLHHAYDNVPMYKRKFDQAGVHPDDLKQLSDLARFPYTTKQDLRDNYPFDTFAVPMEQVVRIHASSAPPAARRWWVTPSATSITGPISSPAVCAPAAPPPKTRCTSPTVTACSPAASARTTAQSGSARR